MTATEAIRRPLAPEELRLIDAYWRAANYLSVGQIYLRDNPLLREPLALDHVKPRLLGHWGTTPGLNLLYAHMNRTIRARDLNAIYVTGPGHGGPGLVANTYLEGTYSEVYPRIGEDELGMRRLFQQFSYPGGIPSHVAPETPGSIHEGGELGYALVHAYGAIYDNPDLLALCVIGDGEAETGPLAASWHSNKFVNPARDGAVLPVLHLNGYKIANPTVLARIPPDELRACSRDTAIRHASWRARIPRLCTKHSPAPSTRRSTRSHRSSAGRARAPPGERDGRWWCCARRRAGPDRGTSTDCPQKAPSARTRCRSPSSPRTPSTCASWRNGCIPTGPRSCSTRTARCGRSSAGCGPRATAAWAPTPTQTAVCSCAPSSFPISASTASRSAAPRRYRARRRAFSAHGCGTSCGRTTRLGTFASSAPTRRRRTG